MQTGWEGNQARREHAAFTAAAAPGKLPPAPGPPGPRTGPGTSCGGTRARWTNLRLFALNCRKTRQPGHVVPAGGSGGWERAPRCLRASHLGCSSGPACVPGHKLQVSQLTVVQLGHLLEALQVLRQVSQLLGRGEPQHVTPRSPRRSRCRHAMEGSRRASPIGQGGHQRGPSCSSSPWQGERVDGAVRRRPPSAGHPAASGTEQPLPLRPGFSGPSFRCCSSAGESPGVEMGDTHTQGVTPGAGPKAHLGGSRGWGKAPCVCCHPSKESRVPAPASAATSLPAPPHAAAAAAASAAHSAPVSAAAPGTAARWRCSPACRFSPGASAAPPGRARECLSGWQGLLGTRGRRGSCLENPPG